MKITLIGEDPRWMRAVTFFRAGGHTVTVAGGEGDSADPDGFVRSGAFSGAFPGGGDVLLFPIPLTRDGVHVTGTMWELSGSVRRWGHFRRCFTGAPTEAFVAEARREGTEVVDLLTDEAFVWKNADLTAEAAVGILLTESGQPLRRAGAALLGYGRIGEALGDRLLSLGASVSVFARNPSVRARVTAKGMTAFSTDEIAARLPGFSLIVNTAPAPLVTADVAARFSPGTFVLDLASGGFLPSPANETWRLRVAPGAPGKYFPCAASGITVDAVYRICRKN